MICDFCSDPNIVCGFPSRDHVTVIDVLDLRLAGGSHGGWAACAPCRDLILAGKRDELTARSVDGYIEKYGSLVPRDAMTVEIRKIHDAFWANREGAPAPASQTTGDATR